MTFANITCVRVFVQGHTHPLCQHEDLDVRDIEEKIRRTLGSRQQKHYLVDPQLATVVAQHLRTGDTDSVIFECNPGKDLVDVEQTVMSVSLCPV